MVSLWASEGAAGATGVDSDGWGSGRLTRCGAARQGLRLCGKVARPTEAGVSGNLSGPFWPHALNPTAQPTRASVMTRIFGTFNMQRL